MGRLWLHIVGQALNGREALERMEELRPHLVFLDVSMPVMDGISCLETLRIKHSETKVIMLSSYPDYNYVRDTLCLGAEDYLLKHEITPKRLLDKLNQLVYNASPTSEEVETGDTPSEATDTTHALLRDSRVRRFMEHNGGSVPPALKSIAYAVPIVAWFQFSVTIKGDDSRYQKEGYLVSKLLETCVDVFCVASLNRVIYLGENQLVFFMGTPYPSKGPAIRSASPAECCAKCPAKIP